jgi:hypothetical protein
MRGVNDAAGAPNLRRSPPGCVHRGHTGTFTCTKARLQHVYTSRIAHIHLPQPEIVGCAIQWHAFTKVAAFPSSRWPPCEELKHAVAVLASINDAARQPRLQPLSGERYDKSRSPKIDPLLTFSILPSHSQ